MPICSGPREVILASPTLFQIRIRKKPRITPVNSFLMNEFFLAPLKITTGINRSIRLAGLLRNSGLLKAGLSRIYKNLKKTNLSLKMLIPRPVQQKQNQQKVNHKLNQNRIFKSQLHSPQSKKIWKLIWQPLRLQK